MIDQDSSSGYIAARQRFAYIAQKTDNLSIKTTEWTARTRIVACDWSWCALSTKENSKGKSVAY